MNSLDLIKMQIQENIENCEILITDESSSHQEHFKKISQTVPSHLTIKVISNSFNGMSLLERHRKINNIMKNYFDQGLHALKIIAKTHEEI